MDKRIPFIFLILFLLAAGFIIWSERTHMVKPGDETEAQSLPTTRESDRFTILEKVKPGGYIGWHQSEKDSLTASPVKTRQSSSHYFVCRDQTGRQRIFQVERNTYNSERVGNVLTGRTAASLSEVQQIEEPGLPSEYEFRRREPDTRR